MLAWFLYIGRVDDYENHRSNLYQEITGGVGVHRALRPQAVHAETQPNNIVQSARYAFKGSGRKAVVFRTQGQPLGQAISRTGCRQPPEQTRPGSQDHNGHI